MASMTADPEIMASKAAKEIQKFHSNVQDYAKEALAVAESSSCNARVKAPREELLKLTMVYCSLILPIATGFIAHLKVCMETYYNLSDEQFVELVAKIASKSAGCLAEAKLVALLHSCMSEDVSSLRVKNEEIERSLKSEISVITWQKKNYEEKAATHERKSERGVLKSILAVTAGCVLGPVGVVLAAGTGAVYIAKHKEREEEALAEVLRKEDELAKAKVSWLQMVAIVNSVQTFGNAINQATKFFSLMNQTLQMYNEQAAEAKTEVERDGAAAQIKLHRITMRNAATDLLGMCADYQTTVSTVDCRLKKACEGLKYTDKELCQDWLNKHESMVHCNGKLLDAGSIKPLRLPGTSWDIMQKLAPKELMCELTMPPVYLEVKMDNRQGAGTMCQTMSVEDLLRSAAEASSTNHSGTNKTTSRSSTLNGNIAVGLPLGLAGKLGGEGSTGYKEVEESMLQSVVGSKEVKSRTLQQTVELKAEPGQACLYRVSLDQRGNVIVASLPWKSTTD